MVGKQVLAGLSDVQLKFINSAGPEERDRLLLQVGYCAKKYATDALTRWVCLLLFVDIGRPCMMQRFFLVRAMSCHKVCCIKIDMAQLLIVRVLYCH